jgi:hypothetical protein
MHALAVTVELLAGSVWVGGLVAIALVARVARQQLAGPARVAFFRTLGRRYLPVGAGTLVVAYVDGAPLLTRGHWSATKSALVVCAGLLIIVTVAGVVQARSLTRLRAAILAGDPRLDERCVSRRAWWAGLLRGLIAGLTFTIVALAAVVVG